MGSWTVLGRKLNWERVRMLCDCGSTRRLFQNRTGKVPQGMVVEKNGIHIWKAHELQNNTKTLRSRLHVFW